MRSITVLPLCLFLLHFHASALLASGVVTVPFVPPGLSPGDTYQIVFVTQGTSGATSADIADYNAFVQSQAEISGALTENWGVLWNAIASTPTVDAHTNATVTAPVYLLDSALVATDYADLWDGSIQHAIDKDQMGGTWNDYVWTGTLIDGQTAASGTEGALGGPSFRYALGGTYATDSEWIFAGGQISTSGSFIIPAHFYAISEVLTVVPEPTSFGTCALISSLGAVAGLGRRRRDVSQLLGIKPMGS